MRTLVDLGYVRQEPSRQYSLGPRLMRLADASTKRLGTLAHRYMTEVVDALGESVNLAVLDGEEIVYVAQVQPSPNFMRMFTEVGRRAQPHTTAVGKAILAGASPTQTSSTCSSAPGCRGAPSTPSPTRTPSSPTCDRIRERGYALDDGEQELGVRCVAVVVPGRAARHGAVDVRPAAPGWPTTSSPTAAPVLQTPRPNVCSAELSGADTRRAKPRPDTPSALSTGYRRVRALDATARGASLTYLLERKT